MADRLCRSVDELYSRLVKIAEEEFSDIVNSAELMEDRLRVYIIDDSFLDVWFSRRIPCKYAFHWERRHLNGSVYRWDNAAHRKVEGLETFPHHFHDGRQDSIRSFTPSDSMEDTLRHILRVIRDRLKKTPGA